jgi:hypothetical protein
MTRVRPTLRGLVPLILGILVALAAPVQAAWAGSVTVGLGPVTSLDFECRALGCSVNPVYLFHLDDFVGQDITGSGLASVDQLSFSLFYENALHSGYDEFYNVFINGVNVTDFDIQGDGTDSDEMISGTASFSAITGPDFNVTFLDTSVSPPATFGSIGFIADGSTSTITISGMPLSVSEPASLTLFGAGLASFAAIRRRKLWPHSMGIKQGAR